MAFLLLLVAHLHPHDNPRTGIERGKVGTQPPVHAETAAASCPHAPSRTCGGLIACPKVHTLSHDVGSDDDDDDTRLASSAL